MERVAKSGRVRMGCGGVDMAGTGVAIPEDILCDQRKQAGRVKELGNTRMISAASNHRTGRL